MNPLQQILLHGQSIWYDFISRDFIRSGEMARLVNEGIRGMTSNPTIFEGAIGSGNSYDDQIRQLAEGGKSVDEIAAALFVADVRDACDVIRPVFDRAEGHDGYISLEVSPTLAHDTEGTFEEAERLWKAVDRPNLMIKIPATPEGMPAIRRAIAAGLNVNITLIFSVDQYRDVVEAYLAGLEDRVNNGEPIDRVHSVASVFVSRIDSLIDGELGKIGTPEALALRGKAGLANSKLVYSEFRRLFSGDRWQRLSDNGANYQRPLWASTSTKNPEYPDLIYVDNLIGPNTVNTVPPATLTAIMDHAQVRLTIEEGADNAADELHAIDKIGISITGAMDQLLREGVEKFAASFRSLFATIEQKRTALREESVE